jgi:hypothetical protein
MNTRSSTKAELITINDALPMVQWTKASIKEQGYDLETIIKEDNRSTMMLMKNGRLSSGMRMKHLDIHFLHLIDHGILLTMEYCATTDMVADFFTKLIQGTLFQLLRDIILNWNTSALQNRSMLGNNANLCMT